MTERGDISPDWIAVDWGTSNLRVYAMSSSGTVLARHDAPCGMAALDRAAFEPELRAALQAWTLPTPCTVLCCGMVGARQGWHEAPYRSVPCPATSDRPVRVPLKGGDLDVFILPGVKQDDPADVMRGEETQIAGFLALNSGFDGVICLPGTHSKWAHVSAGEIVSFRTFLTGELFATIAGHTVLRHSIAQDGWDDDAFQAALSDAMSKPEMLAARLFSLRAEDLLRAQDPASARARLSGLLIGAELAAARPYWLGQRLALVGNGALCDVYASALAAQGVPVERRSASETIRAGLTAAHTALLERT